MTQVIFYILQNQTATGIFPFTCRFLEKAYKQAHKILVQLNNKEDAHSLDQLLWTFNDMSFVPHALSEDTESKDAPIILSCQNNNSNNNTEDIYINLTHNIPENMQAFKRIIEIVPQQEPWLSHSRQKYAKYQQMDYELITHKIAS